MPRGVPPTCRYCFPQPFVASKCLPASMFPATDVEDGSCLPAWCGGQRGPGSGSRARQACPLLCLLLWCEGQTRGWNEGSPAAFAIGEPAMAPVLWCSVPFARENPLAGTQVQEQGRGCGSTARQSQGLMLLVALPLHAPGTARLLSLRGSLNPVWRLPAGPRQERGGSSSSRRHCRA